MGQASGTDGEQTEDLFIAAATSPRTNGADAATRADRLRVSVFAVERLDGWQKMRDATLTCTLCGYIDLLASTWWISLSLCLQSTVS
jgi:hypothetical protein